MDEIHIHSGDRQPLLASMPQHRLHDSDALEVELGKSRALQFWDPPSPPPTLLQAGEQTTEGAMSDPRAHHSSGVIAEIVLEEEAGEKGECRLLRLNAPPPQSG